MRTIPKDSGAALRAIGLRLTGPRHVILEVLRGTESHPTAEWVHRLVRGRLPRVSLGTVYRNLRLLVAEGLVAEIPGPHARFDANLDAHHHFTCVRCRRIVDVDGPLAEPQAEALRVRIAARTGLAITHHRIEFFGRCLQCRSVRARPPRRSP